MKVKELKEAINFIAEHYHEESPQSNNYSCDPSKELARGQKIGRYEIAQEAYPVIQFLIKKIKKYEGKRTKYINNN
jgi:hypothetical protein